MIIENRLWQIPLSESAFADRVPEVIESDDPGELYKLYDSYVESVKAKSRNRN